MTEGRHASFGPVEGDPTVWVIRCGYSMNYVIGRFAPAILDDALGGFRVPVEHVDLFRTFARLHRVTLADAPPAIRRAPTKAGTWTPPPFVREPPDPRQGDINARGVALCRIMLRRAALIREREAGQ
jgi:hypothetical protein